MEAEGAMQMVVGLAEREVYASLSRLARGIRCGVDIGGGAHGEYTLYFLGCPQVEKVFSFEPNTAYAEGFLENLALNGRAGDCRLMRSEKFVGESDTATECTLDSLSGEMTEPCLVKVDVDGGETAVLRGAARLLDRPSVRWLIETHSEKLEAECQAHLATRGYQVRIIAQAWWRRWLPEQRPIPFNRWLVAVRPEDMRLG
jgi:hypothetical protein